MITTEETRLTEKGTFFDGNAIPLQGGKNLVSRHVRNSGCFDRYRAVFNSPGSPRIDWRCVPDFGKKKTGLNNVQTVTAKI